MSTYHQIHFHLIFATQGRRPVIADKAGRRLYGQLAAILRDENARPHCIGGYLDHVHLLVGLRPTHRVSDVVRILKSRSSKWVNEQTSSLRKFGWQKGYGIFSVSHSQIDAVRHYIEHQAEHHRERSYREELVGFLKAHEIDYDPQYIDD